jgi:ribosomal-protein-alanine N-acetyltransferase
MEIASSQRLVFRKALKGDAGGISTLLRKAAYEHKHADWNYPSDWLDSPGFWICERENDSKDNEIVACLSAAADPPPAAWIRIAASAIGLRPETIFGRLIEHVRTELKDDGISDLGWLPAEHSSDSWLANIGFELSNWIITYVKYGLDLENVVPGNIRIQKATLADVDTMVAIEKAAFAPLWRHSAEGLRLAFGHAVCFDVAKVAGQTAGFQYSVRGIEDKSVHLVRITVHPDMQRCGIGLSLMIAALESYKRLGIDQITLNTQLDNLASHRFYERLGFIRTGERVPLWLMKIA